MFWLQAESLDFLVSEVEFYHDVCGLYLEVLLVTVDKAEYMIQISYPTRSKFCCMQLNRH